MKQILLTTLFLAFAALAFGQDTTLVSPDTARINPNIQAEESDTVVEKKTGINPSIVAIESAVIPGLGQISNRQYWKVPIIYGGFLTLGYFIRENQLQYVDFRDAYKLRVDGDTATKDKYDPTVPGSIFKYSESTLLNARENYRRNRDLSIIITAGLYAANILDAYVFAHLKQFDVSEDLSMRIIPVNLTNIAQNNTVVCTLQLNLR
jgi:hypothetical protein